MSKNISTLIEIRRQMQKRSIEGLLGKDINYKGVAFVDKSFQITNIDTNGLVSYENGQGLYLRGENFPISVSNAIIDDFNSNLDKFSVYLQVDVEPYRDEADDSPVPGLEETVSRQKVKFSFIQEAGSGGQQTIEWNSDKELDSQKIWLCDVINYISGAEYEDKRYFSGVPYLSQRDISNLDSILKELKYTDEDGITERILLTKEVPQIPAPISQINKSISKIGSTSLDTLKDKIFIREGYLQTATSLESSLLTLKNLYDKAVDIGDTEFPNEIERLKGIQEPSEEPSILMDSSADFITAGVLVNDKIYNITKQTAGVITNVSTTSVKVEGLTFAVGDEYSIPLKELSKEVDKAFGNRHLTHSEYKNLNNMITLTDFITELGTDTTTGIRKNKFTALETTNFQAIELGKDIGASVDTTEDPSRYRLRLWWEEPTLQENGNPLTQKIVSYMLKVSQVNPLNTEEISTVLSSTQIQGNILKSKGLTHDTVELASKYKSVNNIGKEIYVEIPEGTTYTIRVMGDEKYIVCIAPMTEYGILGNWKSIYVNMNDEQVGGKTLKQDMQEEVKVYKQKEAIAIQSQVAEINRTRSDVDRTVYSFSVIANKPDPLIISESMLRASVPNIPETWKVDYRSINIKLWANDGDSMSDNDIEGSYSVINKAPSYTNEYLDTITIHPSTDLIVTVHFSFIGASSIAATPSMK